MSGMTWLMPSLTTADAEKSKQLPGAPSTDARAPAYAIMCCCPLGGSIPGAPNRASGEALGVGGRRRRPANAGRGVQLLTQPTGGEGFGILSSDAYSLQAAPPASCSSRCGRSRGHSRPTFSSDEIVRVNDDPLLSHSCNPSIRKVDKATRKLFPALHTLFRRRTALRTIARIPGLQTSLFHSRPRLSKCVTNRSVHTANSFTPY